MFLYLWVTIFTQGIGMCPFHVKVFLVILLENLELYS